MKRCRLRGSSPQQKAWSPVSTVGSVLCYVVDMILADRVTQCRAPFIVKDIASGQLTGLNNTSAWREHLENCAIRYVLRDDLVQLCAELAYSKGAGNIQCADLLHAPAESFWVEWSNEPWRTALERYGFLLVNEGLQWVGRRGAFVRASSDGRRGLLRTFWSAQGECDVLASSIEAYFDFDTLEGEEPSPPDGQEAEIRRVSDSAQRDDVLGRCFRFRFEKSWADYYGCAALTPEQWEALWRHAIGTIAMDVPMLLTFLLLLISRSGLPQKRETHERLNATRRRVGKPPLLEHVEVHAPLLPAYRSAPASDAPHSHRRRPRLHHVRGHLVRRGNQLFWRVPHLRGSAQCGAVRSRTVVWTFDEPRAVRAAVERAVEQATVARHTATPPTPKHHR